VQIWIEKHYKLCLILLCIFAFSVRVYQVGEIKSYIFDEVYHSITAKLITRNDPRAYEWWNAPIEPNTAVDWLHPPLAKYTQAIGMKFFGETPFGWRISSVLFGTGVIYLTAELARFLFKDKRIGLLAGFLASMDGLLLVQSRLAMNDIHVTFLLLLMFLCYAWYRRTLSEVIDSPKKLAAARTVIRNRLLLTAVCAGLAMGTKWSGLFGLGVLWLFEFLFLCTELHRLAPTTRKAIGVLIKRVFIFLVIPFSIYILSYSHMFLQGKSLICDVDHVQNGRCYCSQESSAWVVALEKITVSTHWESYEARGGCKRLISHFSELHHQIIWYQTTLEATHAYQSRPLQWFLNLRPVWMYVKYDEGSIANIYAQGNPALFLLGDLAIFASALLLWVRSVSVLTEKKTGTTKKLLAAIAHWIRSLTNFQSPLSAVFYIFIAYVLVWTPWQASPRIMFFYHYTPAVPLLAILLAYWISRAFRHKHGRILAITALAIILVVFIVFYPNWTGIPVSTKFADQVYFSLKSWK